jgi:putative membrane protein
MTVMRLPLLFATLALLVASLAPARAADAAALAAADYVTAVRASDRYTVQAGNLARDRSPNADIRDFGQITATAHERMSQQIGFIAMDLGLPSGPPPPLSEKHQAMLTELRNAAPAEFDARYLAHYAASHQEILNVHRAYAASGDNPRLRNFAADIANRMQRELERAQGMQVAR